MFVCKLFLNVFLSVVLIEAFSISINSTKNDQDDSMLGHYYNKKSMNTESVRETLRKMRKNVTFIDTPANSMHVPFFEETKSKKKLNKSPKRTIQKIIKKSRTRRKFFLNALTSTAAPFFETPLLGEEFTQINVLPIATTQHTMLKKKSRYPGNRYPANYQRQKGYIRTDNFRRSRREAERDNIFILKDFDEVEFLPKEKGFDIAKVHVKKYW